MNVEIPFKDLDIPEPPLVKEYSYEKQKEIFDYLKQLDPMQKKAYLIAQNHLGTSFNIYKSIGFKDFIKNKNNK
jgi:hypothetical protein